MPNTAELQWAESNHRPTSEEFAALPLVALPIELHCILEVERALSLPLGLARAL